MKIMLAISMEYGKLLTVIVVVFLFLIRFILLGR